MTKVLGSLLALSLAAIVVVVIANTLQSGRGGVVLGGGGGLPATVATSSSPTINTTPAILFATSTCATRVITTVASPIMLTFSDVQGKVPSGTTGHLQAASTTVAYDADLYGCGTFRAFGFVSSAITVTESR